MNRQEPRRIISRRNRPAKDPLSREVIVSTALDILRQEGIAGLSLRKVAAALDTGAASLYVYVTNLSELHELMFEEVLGRVEVPTEGNWRKRLTALLTSYVLAMYNQSGIGQIAQMMVLPGPNALRLVETMLGLLLEGGITRQAAAWAVDLLNLYVISQAAESEVRHNDGGTFERTLERISRVSDEYPNVHALRKELVTGESARFDWAVEVFINGFLQTPAAPPAEEGRLQHYRKPTELLI